MSASEGLNTEEAVLCSYACAGYSVHSTQYTVLSFEFSAFPQTADSLMRSFQSRTAQLTWFQR